MPFDYAAPEAFAAPARLWLPTGQIAESYPRIAGAADDIASAASGTLRVVGIVLPKGKPCTTLTWYSGTQAAVAPTAQWSTLFRANGREVIVKSADKTNEAWAADSAKVFTFATPYTPVEDEPVYAGLLQVGGTVASLLGHAAVKATLSTQAPILSGTSTTGLTTPGTLGATAAALAILGPVPYVTAA